MESCSAETVGVSTIGDKAENIGRTEWRVRQHARGKAEDVVVEKDTDDMEFVAAVAMHAPYTVQGSQRPHTLDGFPQE